MPRLAHRLPKYTQHKASGRPCVTVNRKDIYLPGAYGSAESRAEYDRLMAVYLANGRRLPARAGGPPRDLSVAELIVRFAEHARLYYRKPDGSPTSELKNFKDALRPLRQLYGPTPAAEFGRRDLKAVLAEYVAMGRVRTRINRDLGRVKHLFKWAGAEELVTASVYHDLQTVPGLKAGRSAAAESDPVRPVPDAILAAVRPHLSPAVRAMVDLILTVGMRPGEVCAMREGDLDTAAEDGLLVYRPGTHKTAHRGHDRAIFLGPRSREILNPYRRPDDPAAHLFSPRLAVAWHRAQRRLARRTPLSCGNRPGDNVKRRPRRAPGDRYTVEAFCRAVHYACEKAFPPPEPLGRRKGESHKAWLARLTDDERRALAAWRESHRFHPHALRHNCASRLREQHGLDVAQACIGWRTVSAAQVYAERTTQTARRVMAEVG